MLRFLKSLRKNLPQNNKVGSYLLYAIGEITLVVIGILIAVKIGDINEQRKEAQEFTVALHAVETDLIGDIIQTLAFARYYERKDSLSKLVLSNRATKEMYTSGGLNDLLLNNWSYGDYNNGLSEIQKNLKHAPKRYDTLIKRIQDRRQHSFMMEATDQIEGFGPATKQDWGKNYSWTYHARDSVMDPAYLDYVLNSWQYKNIVSNYADLVNELRWRCYGLNSQATQSLVLLRTLNNIPQETILSEMTTLLQLDTIKMEKCRSENPTWNLKIYSYHQFFIVNRRAEPVRVYNDYDLRSGKMDDSFTVIEPNGFITLLAGRNVYSVVRNGKGECLGTYRAGKWHGLIFIN